MTKFYVDAEGRYLGGYDGAAPPKGAIEVSAPPAHGTDTWNGAAWVADPGRVADEQKRDSDRADLARQLDLVEAGAADPLVRTLAAKLKNVL